MKRETLDRLRGAIITSPKLKFYTSRIAIAVGATGERPFLTQQSGYIKPEEKLYEKMVAQFIRRILEDQPHDKRKILEGALDALR